MSWWQRFHRDWRWKRGRVELNASFATWPINLPRFTCYSDGDTQGRPIYVLGVAWGNGNSDPVWSFDIIVTGRRHA